MYIFDYLLLSFPSSTECVCACVSLHRSVLLRLCCALLCSAVCYTCTVLCTVLCIVVCVCVCVSFYACSLYSWDFSNDSNVSVALSKRLFGSPSEIAREKLGLGKEIEEERHLGENSKRRRRQHTTNKQASKRAAAAAGRQAIKQASKQPVERVNE